MRDTPRLIGATIDLSARDGSPESAAGKSTASGSEGAAVTRLDALLFGESQGRILISVAALDAVKVLAQAKILGLSATRIGVAGGETLQIKTAAGLLSWDLRDLHDLWWNAIARAMREA